MITYSNTDNNDCTLNIIVKKLTTIMKSLHRHFTRQKVFLVTDYMKGEWKEG